MLWIPAGQEIPGYLFLFVVVALVCGVVDIPHGILLLMLMLVLLLMLGLLLGLHPLILVRVPVTRGHQLLWQQGRSVVDQGHSFPVGSGAGQARTLSHVGALEYLGHRVGRGGGGRASGFQAGFLGGAYTLDGFYHVGP